VDKKEVETIVSKTQEDVNASKVVLASIQKQRKGALEVLTKKVEGLFQSTDKLTRPSLEGEDGPRILANTLRELIVSLNSVHAVIDSHDKLVDMIINDMMGMVDQLQSTTEGLLHTSMMAEVVMKTLLGKGIFSEVELKQTHSMIAAQAQETISNLQRQK